MKHRDFVRRYILPMREERRSGASPSTLWDRYLTGYTMAEWMQGRGSYRQYASLHTAWLDLCFPEHTIYHGRDGQLRRRRAA